MQNIMIFYLKCEYYTLSRTSSLFFGKNNFLEIRNTRFSVVSLLRDIYKLSNFIAKKQFFITLEKLEKQSGHDDS